MYEKKKYLKEVKQTSIEKKNVLKCTCEYD